MSRLSAERNAERIRLAHRQRLLAWLENFERLHRAPVRTPEEREGKAEALALMQRAYPEAEIESLGANR